MRPDTLYISDLDGTLLRTNTVLSPEARVSLNEMLGEGLHFTVASARSIVSIRKLLAGLDLRLPVIEFNGAFLSDFATGRHEVIHAMNRDVVEGVHRLSLKNNCQAFVSTFDGVEDRLYYERLINSGMEWYLRDRISHGDRRLRRIGNLSDAFHDEVVCITLIARREQLTGLKARILADYAPMVIAYCMENIYQRGWYWLTIHDRRATKDQTMQILRARMQLNQKEVVAFGDHENDIRLLKASDRGVAVANATDAVKEHADLVIGPNDQDSVVHFIRADGSARPEVSLERTNAK